MVRTAGGTGASFRASNAISWCSFRRGRRPRRSCLLGDGGGWGGHGHLRQSTEERMLGLEQATGEGERGGHRLGWGRELVGEGDLGRIRAERVERRRGRLQRTEGPALGGLD